MWGPIPGNHLAEFGPIFHDTDPRLVRDHLAKLRLYQQCHMLTETRYVREVHRLELALHALE